MPVGIGVTTAIEVIVGAPTANTQAAFETLFSGTETQITSVSALTGMGGSATVVNFTNLETGNIEKFLGSIDYNNLTIAVGQDLADAGQQILKAGFNGAERGNDHSFKITTPEGHVYYTTGKISTDTLNGFQPNEIVSATFEIVRSAPEVIVLAP